MLQKGFDTSGIDFASLPSKIFEEINKVRTNPKSIVKQLEKSLANLDGKIVTLGKNRIVT